MVELASKFLPSYVGNVVARFEPSRQQRSDPLADGEIGQGVPRAAVDARVRRRAEKRSEKLEGHRSRIPNAFGI